MVLQVLLAIVSIALIVIVIIQPSKGEGLGAIGGGGQMFFSKNKGMEKFFDTVTMWIAIVFGILLVSVELISKI